MPKRIVEDLLFHPDANKYLGPDGKDMRIHRDRMFMAMARLVSYRSSCRRRQFAGCIIVKDKRPVSMGYTGSPPGSKHCIDDGCITGDDGGCVATLHAEANAIAWAARAGISIEGGTLYTTLSPCLSCAKVVVMSGIVRVVYLEKYRKTDGIDYMISNGIVVLGGSSLKAGLEEYY